MAKNHITVKRKKLSKEIRKVVVDIGVRESDVAYLINNLAYNHTKKDLLELVERDDIPIAVGVFAHALLQDYKKGDISNMMQMISWAFNKQPKEDDNKELNMSDEQLDKEIEKLLLTNKE